MAIDEEIVRRAIKGSAFKVSFIKFSKVVKKTESGLFALKEEVWVGMSLTEK